jgi:hypothetical protein
MDDGNLARDRQPAHDQVLLGDGLQRRRVQGDLAVTDADGAVLAAATGQDRNERLASQPWPDVRGRLLSSPFPAAKNAQDRSRLSVAASCGLSPSHNTVRPFRNRSPGSPLH